MNQPIIEAAVTMTAVLVLAWAGGRSIHNDKPESDSVIRPSGHITEADRYTKRTHL